MPSRRSLLAAVGTGAVAGLAGCSGSNSGGSDTTDCRTSAVSNGDGDLLDGGAMARVEGEDVRLVVPLSVDAVETNDVSVLELYDSAGSKGYTIPVSPNDADLMANKPGVSEGRLYYEQYLGERPFHGRYTVAARNGDDEVLDTVTIEFNCFPEVENEG